MRTFMLAAAAVVSLVVPATAGPTLLVPAQYPTIQAAIDACPSGIDAVVVVMPGTYYENIDFKGKALTVTSQLGPGSAVIDGGGSGAVVTFQLGEGNDSILRGLVIRNGSGGPPGPVTHGGGVHCLGSSPTIRDNLILQNAATFGGGVACSAGSDPILLNNMISSNHAEYGGGLFCELGSNPTVTNDSFTGNLATTSGGGMYVADVSAPTVTNTILWGDTASFGNEVYPPSSNAVVNHCDVQGGYPGTANIDADPSFLDAVNGDLHLVTPSPCENVGDLNAPHLPDEDIDLESRSAYGAPNTGTPDIGADEVVHCLASGFITPIVAGNSNVVLRIEGGPPGSYFGLYITANGLLPNPIETEWGTWYLMPNTWPLPPSLPPFWIIVGQFPDCATADYAGVVPDLSEAEPALFPFTFHYQVATECSHQLSGVGTVVLYQ